MKIKREHNKSYILFPSYSYRKHSIGSNFAAVFAGSIPNTIPINIDIPTEISPKFTETINGYSANITINHAKNTPSINPIKPPSAVKMQDSVRNCINTLLRVAPSAFWMPISRVRSVTDTSIIFITPMPPTNNEIPAILPKTIFIIFVDSFPSSGALNLCSNLGDLISFIRATASFPTLSRSSLECNFTVTVSYSLTPEIREVNMSDQNKE